MTTNIYETFPRVGDHVAIERPGYGGVYGVITSIEGRWKRFTIDCSDGFCRSLYQHQFRIIGRTERPYAGIEQELSMTTERASAAARQAKGGR